MNGLDGTHGFFFLNIPLFRDRELPPPKLPNFEVTVECGDLTSNPGPSERSSVINFWVVLGVIVSSTIGLVSSNNLSVVVTGDHLGSVVRFVGSVETVNFSLGEVSSDSLPMKCRVEVLSFQVRPSRGIDNARSGNKSFSRSR